MMLNTLKKTAAILDWKTKIVMLNLTTAKRTKTAKQWTKKTAKTTRAKRTKTAKQWTKKTAKQRKTSKQWKKTTAKRTKTTAKRTKKTAKPNPL